MAAFAQEGVYYKLLLVFSHYGHIHGRQRIWRWISIGHYNLIKYPNNLFVHEGRNYWIYDGRTKKQKAPLKTAALGVPKAPSAVMHDGIERHTYFFKWFKVVPTM